MPDVLIAGGGIAGSALALMLGRCGVEVELFERSQFPREKPCGEGLMPPGVAWLERWGLAEAVGGVPFAGVRYHFGERIVAARFPASGGAPVFGRGQRRRVLDAALFRAAAATPGVTAHAGMVVEAPILENGGENGPEPGRVAGLRVGGAERRAALVVAADGAHSPLRRQLGLDMPVRRRRVGLRAHFRLARRGGQAAATPPPGWVDIFVQRGRELYVTPLPNDELQVAALAEADLLAEAAGKSASEQGAAERAFERWWRAEPALAARLDGAERVSDLAGMAPLAARARSGFVPGLVLLGDAAGFLDPITGGGMAQALLSAELLASYLVPAAQTATGRVEHAVAAGAPAFAIRAAGLRKGNAWLPDFERERRALLRNYRLMTQTMLWLAGRPGLARATLTTLGRWPALFSHLLGATTGMRPLLRRSFSGRVLRLPTAALVQSRAEATPHSRAAIL